jgi:SAM-dependent methyltransferase
MRSREEISRSEFAQEVRKEMNRSVEVYGHHPGSEYTPAAFRHYIRRTALLAELKRIEFKTMLDVGCAEGFFMNAVRDQSGAETWGVDISDAAVRKARQNFGFNVAAADATNLPFADDTFDIVLSTETIEHVLDPDKMVAEMKRVARKFVIVTTPVSQSADEHEPDFELKEEGHVNDFDRASVAKLFGGDAKLGSFRCNATLAMIKAVGRFAPPPFRDLFYKLDHWVASHFGGPTRSFKPLRNRDWLIVAPTSAAQSNEPRWRCTSCGAAVTEQAEGGFRCENGHTYAAIAPGVPDFAVAVPAG